MEGTGIMLSNSLTPHIHKILKHEGGAIAIDIFFKHDFKFRIISVYLSSTDISRRNSTQFKVTQWIQQALNQQLYPIVLGDFNVDISKTNLTNIKSRLVNFLIGNNLYDLADHISNTSYTWHNNQTRTRIDYIWCYESIIPYLQKFTLEDPSTSTGSDHMILVSTWLFPHANSPKQKQKFKANRRIFDYNSMNKETWEEFANQVDSNLN
jgi:exonuclease III